MTDEHHRHDDHESPTLGGQSDDVQRGEHGAEHGHGHHHHGHAHDRGLKGFIRYVKHTPRMWRNTSSDHVVACIGVQPGMTVVDVGAGAGAGVMPAAARGARVIAVDPTPYMRWVLRLRRLGQRNRKLITVVDGVAESLPIPDGSVDALWAVNAMHHWQDLDAAAREIMRVLRPGGQTLLIDEDFEHPEHEFNQADADGSTLNERHRRHAMAPVGAAQMAEALTAAGLVEVEALNVHIAPTIPTKQASAKKPG